ncbi:MAG: glycerate kinase [Comamonadaceae bacterium SCN 68-20]|nr:glycerate kinase [Comamonadaceae bacterium]ODU58786.1 MAG: glycerate kinase [Comamonadaceae bacterium SCN 68-20]OJX31390.1 MAG: glycerate kinase [Burkholderiales bacterium 68-20]
MTLRNIATLLGIVLLAAAAWHAYGPPGLLAAGGGLVMWGLLHFTRLVHVMTRAARSPIGHVGSAVMLNARLKSGVNLMHVVALARALGEARSAEGLQPEVYRWTDGTHSHVTCEFAGGRLVRWKLVRPAPLADGQAGES